MIYDKGLRITLIGMKLLIPDHFEDLLLSAASFKVLRGGGGGERSDCCQK